MKTLLSCLCCPEPLGAGTYPAVQLAQHCFHLRTKFMLCKRVRALQTYEQKPCVLPHSETALGMDSPIIWDALSPRIPSCNQALWAACSNQGLPTLALALGCSDLDILWAASKSSSWQFACSWLTIKEKHFSPGVLIALWRKHPVFLQLEQTNTSLLPLSSAVKKQDPSSATGRHLPILQWEDKRGLAFTKNNLSYSSKALVIPVSGDYYVYAQVTFRGPSDTSSKTNSVTAVITKVTDSYPEPTQLLTSSKTLGEERNNWFQPIYLGAVVSLEIGDKLMVNVSDIKLVDYTKEHKTFFGAFLL